LEINKPWLVVGLNDLHYNVFEKNKQHLLIIKDEDFWVLEPSGKINTVWPVPKLERK
jgi:hypothetical protein